MLRNQNSEACNILSGVPQGSVIGLTLFLIFINDLGKSLKWSRYKMYADDVVIYTSDTEIDEFTSENHIKYDLERLQEWCLQNAITMSVKKTKFMKFGTRQKLETIDIPNISINNTPLDHVENYKYLGTFLDSKLNFERQANETIKIVNHKLYCISRIKPYISSETMILMYKAYIQPIFDYNDLYLDNTHVRLKTNSSIYKEDVYVVVYLKIENIVEMKFSPNQV